MARINRLHTTHACLPGLGYYSASRDGIGGREVGLYHLWFAGSELYLIAYSHQRQDVRFRITIETTYFDEARLSRSVLIRGARILARPIGFCE